MVWLHPSQWCHRSCLLDSTTCADQLHIGVCAFTIERQNGGLWSDDSRIRHGDVLMKWEDLLLPDKHPVLDAKGNMLDQTHKLQMSARKAGAVLATKSSVQDLIRSAPSGPAVVILPNAEKQTFGDLAARLMGPFLGQSTSDSCSCCPYMAPSPTAFRSLPFRSLPLRLPKLLRRWTPVCCLLKIWIW